MGLYDRPYMQNPQDPGGGQGFGHARVGLPKPGRMITYLLILNIAALFVQALSGGRLACRL